MSAVSVASPTPRRVKAPRWLDARVLVGVALVVGSVVLGAMVVSRARTTMRFWAAARDLQPGTVVQAADLLPVPAHLGGGETAYIQADRSLVGLTLGLPVMTGELIPRSALGVTQAATRVTIPFQPEDAPKLARGQRIEVWVSTKKCSGVPLLTDVTVQEVTNESSSAFSRDAGQTVVVRIRPDLANRVVQALAFDGVSVRAGVLDGPSGAMANAGLPSLDSCNAG
jgi:hypothetical protein